MDQKQMIKQMVEFNKTSFNNAFDAMVMIQNQAGQMSEFMLEQASWVPKDGKKAVSEWVSAVKKGREDFKKTVDDNFKKLEDMLTA